MVSGTATSGSVPSEDLGCGSQGLVRCMQKPRGADPRKGDWGANIRRGETLRWVEVGSN